MLILHTLIIILFHLTVLIFNSLFLSVLTQGIYITFIHNDTKQNFYLLFTTIGVSNICLYIVWREGGSTRRGISIQLIYLHTSSWKSLDSPKRSRKTDNFGENTIVISLKSKSTSAQNIQTQHHLYSRVTPRANL